MNALAVKLALLTTALNRGNTLPNAEAAADAASRAGSWVARVAAAGAMLHALAAAFGGQWDVDPAEIDAVTAGLLAGISICSKLVDILHTAANPNAGKDQ